MFKSVEVSIYAPETKRSREVRGKRLFLIFPQLEPSSDKVLAPSAKWKHQVAQTVLCHPVVMALLESPLDCGTLPQVQNVEIFPETSLATGMIVLSEIDQHILDLLASTCEHFLFDERNIVQKGELRENKSIVAFKNLVETLLLEFRSKLKLCVGTQSYAPLLQPSQVNHALLRFISPFKLLNLARSMLIDVEELASPNLSKIVSLGLDIAGGAFEMLTLYSQQPAAKRKTYDLLWDLEENNYDSNLLEEVYSLACRFSTSFGLVSADTCLLKVGGGIFRGKHNQHSSAHLLTLIISQIVGRTPEDLIIHCINQASMTRAKILFYLVESSPLHRSVFGHFFYTMLSKQQGDAALTDDQLIMLLPAVLSYLSPVFAKPEKPCSRCLDITSVYSNILRNGFLQWPKFSSGCIFEEKYEEILLSANEDIDTMFKASLLGKAVRMFQEHLAWTESPTKTEDLLKARHLVQNCGLFLWCSSLISMFTTKPIRDEDFHLVVVLNILSATLKISRKVRKIVPAHFTITIDGILQLFEAVANCDSSQVEASAEPSLQFPLNRLYDSEEPQEESMVAKFLRWLCASVILGKLYSKANDTDPTVLSKAKPETLLTLLEYFKTRNPEGSETESEHIIGEVQSSEGDYKLIKSLCSRISSPPEATPDWRWSYHQAWKDHSSEPATDLQKIDERHACQHLLLICFE
ncbi:hypothetical protein F2Q69_00034143 [Brassica cretica]|uniref:Nucleolar pre-ribosomal-associated protein 1 C-terminal domain-containing protein n=1 Tax=Brassica cretica TaxID=69181 RepID=A0A8S9SSD5_BRACR|nr:hypothetical protein F2Q69_00034143 [Brassica cretica]